MSDAVTIIHRDRLYIPMHAVDGRALRALLEVPYQTKAHCHQSCPFAQKPGRFCSTCPGRDARIYLWTRVTTPGGARLIAIAGGDRGVLDRVVVGNYRIVDRRADVPFRSDLAWTGKLRRGEIVRGRRTADQRGMLLAWRRSVRSGQSGGVVISPPRSGKTVIGVSAALSERSRTFITASKIDFLRQFGKRFGELTNLRELYARGRRPVVLIDPRGWPDGPLYGVHVLKKWKPEVDDADVVMSCFQQFLDTAGGHARMRRYLSGRFGLVIGDEIHQSAAAMFSRLMNRLDARRKLGLTATISRKDCVHPETLVSTPAGMVRADALRIGDKVYAYSARTNKTVVAPVINRHRRPKGKMLRIRFGEDVLTVTPDHEFWSVTRNAYVAAKELEPGEKLLSSSPRAELSP